VKLSNTLKKNLPNISVSKIDRKDLKFDIFGAMTVLVRGLGLFLG